jgi:predicted GNAT family N-acyltransferase
MTTTVQNQSRGLSLPIGYKVDQDVFINPPQKALVVWEEQHELIVLNRVRKRTEEIDRQKELARKQRRRHKMMQKALGRSNRRHADSDISADDSK